MICLLSFLNKADHLMGSHQVNVLTDHFYTFINIYAERLMPADINLVLLNSN
jgi:hypothetical protein